MYVVLAFVRFCVWISVWGKRERLREREIENYREIGDKSDNFSNVNMNDSNKIHKEKKLIKIEKLT